MPHDVFALGNALVDIQSVVTEETLTKLGYDKGIMTLVDDETQSNVLSHLTGQPHRCAGGSAANTIAALADFGGNGAFLGKIGNDETGSFFVEDLRRLGVTLDLEPTDAGPTGTCAVLITDDAQRTMLTNLGASAHLCAADVDEAMIANSRYVYIEGYLLGGPETKAAAYRTMELAKANDVKVALTVSDPFLVNMLRDEMWEMIRGPVDLLFCNEEEAKSLTGLDDPIACANEIHSHAENVALTLGEKGAIVMHAKEAIPIEGVSVDAIDTTGAGDMFAGGLLYGITNGLSWRQAGHLASHAASRIVSQMGARLEHRFTKEELARFSDLTV